MEQVWESIEAIVPRRQLREFVDAVSDMVPPPGADGGAEMRARLTERIATVTPFLKILTEVIEFGCTPEGEAALAAMRSLPRLLDRRTKVTAADIDHALLSGSWKSLVLPKPGGIDRNAYVFCVLAAFHRHLRRREIYAGASSRWRDPRAQLLAGEEWERKKGPALTDLQLREDSDALLAEQARALDAALRDVAAQVSAGTIDAQVDDQGRLHVSRLTAIPEPPSLVDLRKRVAAMLPRVDLPEVILEVMAWVPGVHRRVHLGVGRPDPAGGPARLGSGVPDRPGPEHRVRPGRQPRCAGAGAGPAGARVRHLPVGRDVLAGQRPADRRAGRHLVRPGAGRRPGRRDRRDAVRGPRPQRLRPAQPQVLRTQARRDLAQHDQRPGRRARRQGRGRDRPRLAPHDRRAVQPGRRAAARHRGLRYRLVLGPGVRPGYPAGRAVPARAGRPSPTRRAGGSARRPATAR